VQALRTEAEIKANAENVREQQQLRQQQALANKQVKDAEIKRKQETAAAVQRDAKVAKLKPVAQSRAFTYQPSPTIVISFVDDVFSDVKTTLLSWPGGKKIEYKAVMYWWGATYYYRDGIELDEKTYTEELAKYKRS
jgi:hypothetical protein